jgi:hypothetical protein
MRMTLSYKASVSGVKARKAIEKVVNNDRFSDEDRLEAIEAMREFIEQLENRNGPICAVCLKTIHTAELCKECAVGNDPFLSSKYADRARG